MSSPAGRQLLTVQAIAVAAGVAGALAGAMPTGIALWDALLTFVLATVVVLAWSKAPRWVAIVGSGVAAAAAGLTVWAILGWAALLLAFATVYIPRRNRLLGAVTGALAMQALLRIPAFGFFGLPSLIAGAVFLLVLVQGYRYASSKVRRRSRHAVGGLSVVTAVVLLVGGVQLLAARGDVDRGVAAARRGLQGARDGDTTAVVAELEIAERALNAANARVDSIAARSLRLVPIVAQHHESIDVALAQGVVVADEAGGLLREADIESINFSGGEVDLAALAAMAPRLNSTTQALIAASTAIGDAQSSWVLPMVQERIDELQAEVDGVIPEIELAAEAALVVPGLLGADTTQTYFVMFGTPAESREFGGFVGSWALVSFNNGQVALIDSGRKTELYPIARESEIIPGTVPDWFLEMARPATFPENLTSSPDFGVVAEASRQVLAELDEEPFDGIIYLDAWALIDLLELTGPVQTPFQEAPLSVDNAQAFFFRDQYRFEGEARTEAFDELAEVGREILQRLSTQELPGPEALGRVLGPAARAGRLQVITFDAEHNEFLRSVRLLRDFDQQGTSDFVGVVQSNALANKMDLYLTRALDYQVRVEDDGSLTATATVTLRSVIPSDAPDYTVGSGETQGQNNVLLSLYSPHVVQAVTVNGMTVEFAATIESGMGRYLVDIVVPPNGEPFVVEFDLEGQLAASSYSLEVWHQPLVNSDEVTIAVDDRSNGRSEWAGVLVENHVLLGEQ